MIDFLSVLPPETIARELAAVIYDRPIPGGLFVPWLANSLGDRPEDVDTTIGGYWYELSRANDHKLDVRGGGSFTFRDRYNVPERRQRVLAVLARLGCEIVTTARV
jgi:hypothetical protein